MRTYPLTRRFLPFVLTLVCLVAGAAHSLRAGTVKFPADKPTITLELPDGWTAVAGDNGVLTCKSPDGNFNFQLLPSGSAPASKAALESAASSIMENSGLTDPQLHSSEEKANPNGVKEMDCVGEGKNGDKTYYAVVCMLTTQGGEKCGLLCFNDKDAIMKYSKDMSAITDSIKPAN